MNPFGVDEDVRPSPYPRERIGLTDHEGDATVEELQKVIHMVRSEEEALLIADIFEKRYGYNLSGISSEKLEEIRNGGDENTDQEDSAGETRTQRIKNRSAESLVSIGSATIRAGIRMKRRKVGRRKE